MASIKMLLVLLSVALLALSSAQRVNDGAPEGDDEDQQALGEFSREDSQQSLSHSHSEELPRRHGQKPKKQKRELPGVDDEDQEQMDEFQQEGQGRNRGQGGQRGKGGQKGQSGEHGKGGQKGQSGQRGKGGQKGERGKSGQKGKGKRGGQKGQRETNGDQLLGL